MCGQAYHRANKRRARRVCWGGGEWLCGPRERFGRCRYSRVHWRRGTVAVVGRSRWVSGRHIPLDDGAGVPIARYRMVASRRRSPLLFGPKGRILRGSARPLQLAWKVGFTSCGDRWGVALCDWRKFARVTTSDGGRCGACLRQLYTPHKRQGALWSGAPKRLRLHALRGALWEALIEADALPRILSQGWNTAEQRCSGSDILWQSFGDPSKEEPPGVA